MQLWKARAGLQAGMDLYNHLWQLLSCSFKYFSSSPAKDGNAVKTWLLWDAAARHFVQLCIHTVLGFGARESFVCELCSCEHWDFSVNNFKDPSRS